MRRSVKQYGLLLVGVGVAVAVIAPAVIAATGDTDDSVSPASTLVTTKVKTGTKTTFLAEIGAFTVTQHCTGSSTTGTTPAHGLGMVVAPVSFTGCSDSLGGTDTVKTTGTWRVTFVDAPNDETTEPPGGASSGDKLRITVPEKGATVVSSFDPECLITVAPTKAASVTGAYNDINTLTISKAAVPISLAAACPGGAKTENATFTATYTVSPGVHDVS
jgi:hypothetical protein